ncbi:putative transporter protein [Agrobacterium fabacearum S56]|uniref:MFS transporter n=1 Tax=Agrobacterium tumefaciens TaxID=358 RepID=UPI0009B986B0|nr:MFS transporter [Agrobacterium tumefaciens]CUX06705.1 putative transporter protein [Agrobacterium fabacearum S56]
MIRSKINAENFAPSFNWFLAAVFVSAVGRNGYNVACAWLLVVSGEGVASVATFFMVSSAMEMVTSPACGWICDRYDRRFVSIFADCLRVVGAILLGLLLSLEDFHWAIWLSTMVFATCDRLSLTATQSMIPHVGARLSQALANSATFFFMQVGSLVAAALIGLILFISAPIYSLSAIAFVFACSVVCMIFVGAERQDRTVGKIQPSRSLFIDSALLRLGLIYCLLYVGGLLVSAVGPTFVFEELKGNALDFGHFESAWSAGSILGAVLLIPFVRLAKIVEVLIIVLFVTAISFASIKLTSFPFTLLGVCILGASYNLGRVAIEVSLQSSVPHASLGRAKGVLHGGAMALGIVVLGLIAVFPDAISPTTIFLAYSAVIIVCTLGMIIGLLKNK